MFYSLSGKLIAKKQNFVAIEANGIGFKISVSAKTIRKLPKIGSRMKLFCHTSVRQDGVDLYGFLDEEELEIFELLNTVNSIGPKMALKILSAASGADGLLSAVSKNKPDVLTKISGIGRKTAERIILELGDKIKNLKINASSEEYFSHLETDDNIERILQGIGFKKNEVREALKKMPIKVKKLEERLKEALKFLSK